MNPEKASFRDPAGFVFEWEGQIYRCVKREFFPDYDGLCKSPLYQKLVDNGLLIPHIELDDFPKEKYGLLKNSKIIKPKKLFLISYPHEWCFSALQKAALATLEIQEMALKHQMSLKDASAYNLSFNGVEPIFFDTTSFEQFKPLAWQGYGQFCRHFLGPLLLQAYVDSSFGLLLSKFIDGCPIALVSSLLPWWRKFMPRIFFHVVLHGSLEKKVVEEKRISVQAQSMGVDQHLLLLGSLRTLISNIQLKHEKTTWDDYYYRNNYSESAFQKKETMVLDWIKKESSKTLNIVDLGANTGHFSRALASNCKQVISIDQDPMAVELNFRMCVEKKIANVFPMVLDLANIDGGFGYLGEERSCVLKRINADMALALALIHHLYFSSNMNFSMILKLLFQFAPRVLLEWVEPEDGQVQILAQRKPHLLFGYDEKKFIQCVKEQGRVVQMDRVPGACRKLILLEKS